MQEMQYTWVHPLDWEDPLEEGMKTHSSILACRIPMDIYGQRRLAGYSSYGHKASATTEGA